MLPRKPTRIELKPEDKEEYDKVKEEKERLASTNSAAGASKATKPLRSVSSTAARIGLNK